MQYRIGIDIGGTKTKLAAIDEANQIFEKQFFSTKECKSDSDYTDALLKQIENIKQKVGNQNELFGIGIGAPSVDENGGKIKYAANLPFKSAYPVVELIQNAFKIPAQLCRDSIAALLGEWKYGNGNGFDNLVLITLGTGLGGGFIINGELAKGKNGLAGEIGHINLFGNQRRCGCGRVGCLETYVSATGLKRTYFELLSKNCYPLELKKVKNLLPGSREMEAEAEEGNEIAKEAFRITGEVLGKKLADLVLLLELEAVILSGGLASAGSWIFDPVKANMENNLLEMYKGKCQILPSAFSSNEGALLGAASLISLT